MHPSIRLLQTRRRLRRVPRIPAYIAGAATAARPDGAEIPMVPRPPRGVAPVETPLGCLMVRRIVDRAGRPWTVRELPSRGTRATERAGHDAELSFQCALPGVGTAIRRTPRSLESLTDAALAAILERDAS